MSAAAGPVRERVHLGVRPELRFRLLFLRLSTRGVALLVVAALPAFAVFQLPIDVGERLAAAALLVMAAVVVAELRREHLWLGTWWLYRALERWLPAAVVAGVVVRARVGRAGTGTVVAGDRRPLRLPRPLAELAQLPRRGAVGAGLFELRPGGWSAVLRLQPPSVSVSSTEYARWCRRLLRWLADLEVPSQLWTRVGHADRRAAVKAWERRFAGPGTTLYHLERELAGEVAEQSLLLETWVVLQPGAAGPDGRFRRTSPWRGLAALEPSREEAAGLLQVAVRKAGSYGVEFTVPGPDEVLALLAAGVLDCRDAAFGSRGCTIDGREYAFATVTELPPWLGYGAVVHALMNVRVEAHVALAMVPLAPSQAQRRAKEMLQTSEFSSGQDRFDRASDVAAARADQLLLELANRDVSLVAASLNVAAQGDGPEAAVDALERLRGALASERVRAVRVTVPGFAPALAVAPGGTPLGRSHFLLTDRALACLVPALGTPLADPSRPLVGINVQTGAPAYLNCFAQQKNANKVVIGATGAGKSVELKTSLVRHIGQGARAVILDPDDEYEDLVRVLGGRYHRLGPDSLNMFSAVAAETPSNAAGALLPVLSVLAGDVVGHREDRPVRQLPDEDKGFLRLHLAGFLAGFGGSRSRREPVLSDFVRHLEGEVLGACATGHEAERCRVVIARLRNFTHGPQREVFDRPSSFGVDGGERVVGVGLRRLALQYRADLTPALAIVLSHVLSRLTARPDPGAPLIVLVDEAHNVTTDPDAGTVLVQLARKARKYGAGLWCASQQIDDFLRSPIGKVIIDQSSTRVVLQVEDTVLPEVIRAFHLSDEEAEWLRQDVPGLGVVMAGRERGPVRIVPPKHAEQFMYTTAAAMQAQHVG